MDITPITESSKYWNQTISFAENCSWRAGPFLADKMRQGKFKDWERVFVAIENEKIVGYCTFCEKDELPDSFDFTPFIGFMFVDEKHRGKRISEKLIDSVVPYAHELGFSKVYIMSGEVGLYEKYGFQKIGEFETVYGTVDQLFVRKLSGGCSID